MTCKACGKKGLTAMEKIQADGRVEPCCWECLKWFMTAAQQVIRNQTLGRLGSIDWSQDAH